MLDKLLMIHRRFLLNGEEIEPPPVAKPEPVFKVRDYKDDFYHLLRGTYEESILAVEKSRFKDYDKGRAVCYMASKFPGWHRIGDIPTEFIMDFIKQMDMNPLMELDEERNCEYFRHI